jgi:hypothetical protein
MTASQRMPNAHDVIIEHRKITRYLLNLEHEDGGPKARFFLAHGFTRCGWRRLSSALRQHALFGVLSVEPVIYGVKYEIIGPFPMPDGVIRELRSVWMIDVGASSPRLITAYPAD